MKVFLWNTYVVFVEQSLKQMKFVSQPGSTMLMRPIYQNHLMRELLGQTVRRSAKLETRETVDPTGYDDVIYIDLAFSRSYYLWPKHFACWYAFLLHIFGDLQVFRDTVNT